MDESYDLIISPGQVVPHEVIGMANHSKNLFVGVGGSDMINKSHMVGAVYGIERMMGKDHTPVRKIFDYGKYKYEQQKKKNEARKNQKVVNIKELKLRPMIDTHDYEVKIKQARKFLTQGDKVKFTMRFKGREMSANDMGIDVLIRIVDDLEGICKGESEPKLEGRQMTMVVAPQ